MFCVSGKWDMLFNSKECTVRKINGGLESPLMALDEDEFGMHDQKARKSSAIPHELYSCSSMSACMKCLLRKKCLFESYFESAMCIAIERQWLPHFDYMGCTCYRHFKGKFMTLPLFKPNIMNTISEYYIIQFWNLSID